MDLQFSVKANLYAYEYTPTEPYWAAAAICLRYLGSNNNLLGETRIAHRSPHCPWTNSSTVHLITPPISGWNTYSFDIAQELLNLGGINPANIKKIEIALLDTTDGC